MAYKLIWSPAARDDLHDIVVFIARDNPNRAMSFGYELISETDRLQEFQSWAVLFASIGTRTFAKLFFGPTELCTEWITSENSARLRAFGIQREGFRNCEISARHLL